MKTIRRYGRNLVLFTHAAVWCTCVQSALAAGTLYARAIGEPPEPEPRPAPTAPRTPPNGRTAPPASPTPSEPETPPPENRVKSSTILIGLGVAAALAALGGGGGGGGGGGDSTTSH